MWGFQKMVKIQNSKIGKKRLPYYCNKVYYNILTHIEKKEGIRGINISSNTQKDHSVVYRHLKQLQKDNLIIIKKGNCFITNKGNICIELARNYFREEKIFKEKCQLIQKQYNLLIKVNEVKPNSSHD